MSKICFLTRSTPTVDGFGGNHRSYQILESLRAAFGDQAVSCIDLEVFKPQGEAPKPPLLTRALYKASSLLPKIGAPLCRIISWPRMFAANPLKLTFDSGFSPHYGHYRDIRVMGYVRDRLREQGKVRVCIVDDVRLIASARLGLGAGVKVVLCPQNLESLDFAAWKPLDRDLVLRSIGLDLASELKCVVDCEARLTISKIEAGLLLGLGMPTRYFPYLPVGALRDSLREIAERRRQNPPAANTFLMLGTAEHMTTATSFGWFLDQARRHGLPAGCKVVLAGSGTDRLNWQGIAGVSALGRISQSVMTDLLRTSTAVIALQTCGFGVMTKLSEFACAGVPVLTSELASHMLDLPPGCKVLPVHWEAWQSALNQPTSQEEMGEYPAWEAAQADPLQDVISALL